MNPLDLKDASGRRRRSAPRQPSTDKKARLSKTQLRLLQFIDLYGGYSTTGLVYEFAILEGITKQKDQGYISEVLKEMYHDFGVLSRPKDQRWCDLPDKYDTVHKITEKGVETLQEAGLYSDYAIPMHGFYKHQVMNCILYQCFYLNARKLGIPFTPQHELIAGVPLKEPRKFHIDVPQDGREDKKVFPDAVFMLGLEKNVVVYLESDRGTERGHDPRKKTWASSIRHYDYIIGQKVHTTLFNQPDALCTLAVVTTSSSMMKTILTEIGARFPKGHSRILVHYTDKFGNEEFTVTKYFDILAAYWERSVYPVYKFT